MLDVKPVKLDWHDLLYSVHVSVPLHTSNHLWSYLDVSMLEDMMFSYYIVMLVQSNQCCLLKMSDVP